MNTFFWGLWASGALPEVRGWFWRGREAGGGGGGHWSKKDFGGGDTGVGGCGFSPLISFNLSPSYIWGSALSSSVGSEAPRLLSSPDGAQQLLTHTLTCFQPSINFREADPEKGQKLTFSYEYLFSFLHCSRVSGPGQLFLPH